MPPGPSIFVKDVIGPRGAVSIQSIHSESNGASAKVEDHVRANAIRVHHAELTPSGSFARPDEWLTQTDEPGHDELCRREQEFFVRAVREQLDLTSHLEDSLASLSIVLAAGQARLFETMQALDTQLFDAANHCDYEKLTAMVDENLEFYHDQGGLMLGRQAFLDAIKHNTCGVMIRELVPGTLQVYPLKDYGAIEMGVHRFHHPGHEKEFPSAKQLGMTRFLESGAAGWPVGEAKFLHIWRLKDGSWKLTRVVSYGH